MPDGPRPAGSAAIASCLPGTSEVVAQSSTLGDGAVLAFERPQLAAFGLGKLLLEAVDASAQARFAIGVQSLHHLISLARRLELLVELLGLLPPAGGSALGRPGAGVCFGAPLIEGAFARRIVGMNARAPSSRLRLVRDLTYREECFVLDAFLHGCLLVVTFVSDETEYAVGGSAGPATVSR
ncbi:MAG: hypothetical protein ACRDY6_08600 [Acidimicrobiia bacterium]